MAQVQKSIARWSRLVQRTVGKDEDGHDILEIEEVPVVMLREDYGRTSCFAENEHIMRGLRRVHIYAA